MPSKIDMNREHSALSFRLAVAKAQIATLEAEVKDLRFRLARANQQRAFRRDSILRHCILWLRARFAR